jgi:transcriptional regulator with XRE-family HTH domain
MNKDNVFDLMGSRDICLELGRRARTLRLTQNITQKELAERAGLSFGTVRNLEMGKPISLQNFVQILEALGRVGDLEKLMVHEQILSISQLEKLEQASQRIRATRKTR